MSLNDYTQKRDFEKTLEPLPLAYKGGGRGGQLSFVVQEHHARHLHWDLRLEFDGILKSWALPKGPSLDPSHKRLAVMTEDHPLDYADFEGAIEEGQYGAGQVYIWDKGTVSYMGALNEVKALIENGSFTFKLKGEKLNGEFALVRLKNPSNNKNWLLIKKNDEFSIKDYKLELAGEK